MTPSREPRRRDWGRRLIWFVALWAGGAGAVVAASYLLRALSPF